MLKSTAKPSDQKKGQAQPGPSILVVDDDVATLRVIEMLLERNGYTVRTVPTGEEALTLLPGFIPAVMILDVNMPGMSGFDVCQIIKRHDEYSKIPIILLSGEGTPQDYKTGHDAGAVIYMVKPFKAEKLLQVVRLLTVPNQP